MGSSPAWLGGEARDQGDKMNPIRREENIAHLTLACLGGTSEVFTLIGINVLTDWYQCIHLEENVNVEEELTLATLMEP
ncbi:hypothetical protein AV530_006593 [Patagioenas fasciata monilis]|uniref:Uncharacterized protein n=1 Tax=Patagioenas fasciata monilis TaxID=372326 RepID=A0A1V4KH91_PATFA|nr:hypothetical protein AV530_006593 [Patagioenas fasciata monilis]